MKIFLLFRPCSYGLSHSVLRCKRIAQPRDRWTQIFVIASPSYNENRIFQFIVGLKTLNLCKFQFERCTSPCINRFKLICGTYVHSKSVYSSKQLKIRLNEKKYNHVN